MNFGFRGLNLAHSINQSIRPVLLYHGRWVPDTSALRSTFHNMPDRFRRDAIAPDFAHPVYSPENCPPTDFRPRDPRVDGSLHPARNRNRAHVLSLADQVCDNPVLLPDLEVLRLEAGQLCPPQPTTNQHSQNRLITLCPDGFRRSSKVLAWSIVNQLPILTPKRFAPLTRRIPAASSELNMPVSQAS